MTDEFLEQAVVQKEYEDEMSIHKAAFYGYLPLVKKQLDEGADVDSQNNNGSTVLHLASMLEYNQRSTIDEIFKQKPSLNITDKFNQTPVNLLVTHGRYDPPLLQRYLEAGADPNVPDLYGHSPLHHMIMFPLRSLEDWAESISLMILFGANINSIDIRGNTPLHVAAANGHEAIVQILLEYDVDIHIKNLNNQSPVDIAFMSKSTFPDILDKLGKRLLMQHALNENIQLKCAQKIKAMTRFQEFWENCNNELKQLKNDFIGETRFSYYQFMTKPPNKMSKIFNNEENTLAVSNFNTNKYVIFGRDLQYSFQKPLERYHYTTFGYQFQEKVWPWMPIICMEKIISFLDDNDLKNLAGAINLVNL